MKKINRKGFTLIELLAVIVILAIIVVVTVPSIISSINNARLSSLHSLSKEVAEWYDTSLAQDVMALGNEKILDGLDVPDDGKWHCLHDLDGDGDPVDDSLADVYGLSSNDINLGGDVPSIVHNDHFYETDESGCMVGKADFSVTQDHCSGIRIKNNRAEVYLVATKGGKFDTTGSEGDSTYAVSYGENGFNDVC